MHYYRKDDYTRLKMLITHGSTKFCVMIYVVGKFAIMAAQMLSVFNRAIYFTQRQILDFQNCSTTVTLSFTFFCYNSSPAYIIIISNTKSNFRHPLPPLCSKINTYSLIISARYRNIWCHKDVQWYGEFLDAVFAIRSRLWRSELFVYLPSEQNI